MSNQNHSEELKNRILAELDSGVSAGSLARKNETSEATAQIQRIRVQLARYGLPERDLKIVTIALKVRAYRLGIDVESARKFVSRKPFVLQFVNYQNFFVFDHVRAPWQIFEIQTIGQFFWS